MRTELGTDDQFLFPPLLSIFFFKKMPLPSLLSSRQSADLQALLVIKLLRNVNMCVLGS